MIRRSSANSLDVLAGGNRIFPVIGAARWTALRRQALADGIMDAAVLTRYEEAVRPQRAAIAGVGRRAVPQDSHPLEALDSEDLEGEDLESAFDIGAISVACGLGYLDLRSTHKRWRSSRPHLTACQVAINKRPSLAATAPPAP